MRTAILSVLLLWGSQIQKNDPNGVWVSAETGTQFRFQLTGPDLKVVIVDGSNPRYLKYEVNLQVAADEVNTYRGKGYWVAKSNAGKECRFETTWEILIVSPDQLFGKAPQISFDSATCEIKEKGELVLDLKKKK